MGVWEEVTPHAIGGEGGHEHETRDHIYIYIYTDVYTHIHESILYMLYVCVLVCLALFVFSLLCHAMAKNIYVLVMSLVVFVA